MNFQSDSFQFLDNVPKICVVIRKRPLTKKELLKGDQDIAEVREPQTVIVRESKQKVDLTKYTEEHLFNFDRSFHENTTNQTLYEQAVRPLIDALFNRAKCTCFAYGQTGSGKTFTMMGSSVEEGRENQISTPGLYLLAAQDIFSYLEYEQYRHLGIFISFYEIYCGKLHDLLNDRQEVFAREDGKKSVNIVGLSEKRVLNLHSLMQTIDFGNSVRTTGSTSANVDSSRSHAILQIALKDNKKVYGKMSFIDLAGSERGADTADTNKQTRIDGAEINKSLLALKECIRALDQEKKHTPFRGSKLTLVLKDSFVGNCKTVMIGNISPGASSCEHTLNTLRYADRVKELKRSGESTDNAVPLTKADLLAKQLMLPRMEKNSVKRTALGKDDNEMSIEMANGNLKLGNTNQSQRSGGNDRLSMPVVRAHSSNLANHISNLQNNQLKRFSSQVPSAGGWIPATKIDNNSEGLSNYGYQSLLTGQLPLQQQEDPQELVYNIPTATLFSNLTPAPNENYPVAGLWDQDTESSLFKNTFKPQVPTVTDARRVGGPLETINLNVPSNIQQLNSIQQQFPSNNLGYGGLNYANKGGKMSIEKENNPINVQYQPPTSSDKLDSKLSSNVENKTVQEACESFKNEQNLNVLQQKHEELLSAIFSEEQKMILAHREHIDEIVTLTKQEMGILHEVDRPASDIDQYLLNLEAILNRKSDLINSMKERLSNLRQHISEEETLSKAFFQNQRADAPESINA